MTDLRGDGDSSKPPGGGDHRAYSKRGDTQDQVEVMRHLAFEKFALIEHDLGRRAAHRLAPDYPEALAKLIILDCADTSAVSAYRVKNPQQFYQCFLLVRPPPFLETVVHSSAEYFLKCTLLWLGESKLTEPLPDWVSPAVFHEYLRTFRRPDRIHAICEDYGAAVAGQRPHS